MRKQQDIDNPEVAAVFGTYPKDVRTKLMALRQLIFDVASKTDGVGPLEETLKWGQPSYLTTQSKSGSLVRIDQIKSQAGKYAMYFHCHTTLVETFKELYRGRFEFGGNRSIIFGADDTIPMTELSHCIAMALTYHLDKRAERKHSAHRSSGRAKAARR
ncbi:MAG: DUF1801 domain-containing protein [Nitrospirota bacterium]